MEKNMNAVVTYAPHDYRYEKFPMPQCGKDDIIIRVILCGICAGDLKAWEGGPRFWGGEGWDPYVEPPCIPGHEFVGEIVAIGEENPYWGKLKIGQRVVPEQVAPCGSCYFCKKGQYHLCQPHDVFGFKNYLNGGFAQFARLPKTALVHAVPDSIPDELAVLIEPFACSMHAVDRAQIEKGDTVVLAGAGPLGLGMVAAAKLKNPGKLIVLDMRKDRLEKAKALGADIVLDPSSDDVYKEIAKLTQNVGCDIYIEATGHPSAVQQGLDLLRKGGRFVEFSVFSKPAVVDWSIIGDGKELDIIGVSLSPNCFGKVIEGFTSGELKADGVLTDIYPLSDFEEAFKRCSKEGAVKVALKP